MVRGSAFGGCVAGFLQCDIAQIRQMIQHRLDSVRSLEAAADPHDVPAGEFQQTVFYDAVQCVLTLLHQVIRSHEGVGGTGMLRKVSANGNGTTSMNFS